MELDYLERVQIDFSPDQRDAFELGRIETKNNGRNVLHPESKFDNSLVFIPDREYLREIFFLTESDETWLEDTVNFATPEEIENEFAFYLGASYINIDQYKLLMKALRVSKFIHSNEKRRDGLRRSLYGHILPGLRFIFDNREEVMDHIFNYEGDDQIDFFESVFAFMGHDWLEDIKDGKFAEYIEDFPQYLQEDITSLTHFKGNGETIGTYANKIAGSKRVIKFVKMIDRMVNHIDDIGKAPSLRIISDEHYKSKPIIYVEETQTNYLPIFETANLPLYGKFKEVVGRIKGDNELSKDFFTNLNMIVLEWIDREVRKDLERESRGFSPLGRPNRYGHIIGMIKDLEENSAEYGVVNSTGMVGAILIHDFVLDFDFQNKLRSILVEYDKENPKLAELLRYSIGIAYSAKAIEAKAVIHSDEVSKIFNLKNRRDLTPEFKENLKSIFRKPPEDENPSRPNKRKESFEFFRNNLQTFFNLRPSMGSIPLKAFRDSQVFDVEGVLLCALEKFNNIDNTVNIEKRDPTYLWRQLQESLYFIIPLVESFGLKGMAKALTNKIEGKIQQQIIPQETLEEIRLRIDRIVQTSLPVVKDFETAITRAISADGVIEVDKKGTTGIVAKFIQENRSAVTDINRSRIVLPGIEGDGYFMIQAFEVIDKIIEEFIKLQENREDGFKYNLSIGRPYERVDGEYPKLAVRISVIPDDELVNLANDFERKMKKKLGIPAEIDLVQFPNRVTKYSDVKLVFMINNPADPEGDPIYYEMIITDSTRHHNNTFGTAARVHKFIASKVKGSNYQPNESEVVVLQNFYLRSALYAIMSTKGSYISEKSKEWLKYKKLATDKKIKGRNIVDRFKGIITKNSSYIFP